MNATEIEGWMRRRELKWLAKHAAQSDLIVEIGAWYGKSTYAMAEVVRGRIITIDSFVMEGIPIRLAKNAHAAIQTDPDWIYNSCLKNLSEFIASGKVQVIRGRSNKVIEILSPLKGKVDMVFIDGSHDYNSVKEDILNYRPLVKEGGLLCGHDYTREVKKVVDELLPGFGVGWGTTIWFIKETNGTG